MMTVINKNVLGQRLLLSQPTLRKRMIEKGIQPDVILIRGSGQPSSLFDVERLPDLRRILCNPPQIIV
jgi:hypothetical protein